MTHYITIRQSIERAIAAIDRGEIAWAQGIYGQSGGAMCIIGAASHLEEMAGGKGGPAYRVAMSKALPGLRTRIESINDSSRSWHTAKMKVRAVLNDPAYNVDWSPAGEAEKKAGK